MDIKRVISKVLFIKLTIFKVVAIKQSDLIDRIVTQLDQGNYPIVSRSDNQIVFNTYNKFAVISTSEYATKLPAGIFELNATEGQTNIKLSYAVSILSELTLFIVFSIWAIYTDYWPFLFIILLVFRILIKTRKLKSVAEKLMVQITKYKLIPKYCRVLIFARLLVFWVDDMNNTNNSSPARHCVGYVAMSGFLKILLISLPEMTYFYFISTVYEIHFPLQIL